MVRYPRFFEIFGEAYFRELERKTIEDVLTSPTIATQFFRWVAVPL